MRFPGWLERFLAAHPQAQVRVEGAVTTMRWPQGQAICEAFPPDPVGVLLVRRGGYAVARVDTGLIVASKVGRRHVQGRTAAGGWSQQRFARRRENQADVLVEAVIEHVRRLLLAGPSGSSGPAGSAGGIRALVVGGDRALCAAVLAHPSLRALGELPRRELPGLPNPDARVLAEAVRRGLAVWVDLSDLP
ncbi:MAG: acVLRF1 family peptidyl-tRNA hydrolase [Candidatus Phosphoribacter sp.]